MTSVAWASDLGLPSGPRFAAGKGAAGGPATVLHAYGLTQVPGLSAGSGATAEEEGAAGGHAASSVCTGAPNDDGPRGSKVR